MLIVMVLRFSVIFFLFVHNIHSVRFIGGIKLNRIKLFVCSFFFLSRSSVSIAAPDYTHISNHFYPVLPGNFARICVNAFIWIIRCFAFARTHTHTQLALSLFRVYWYMFSVHWIHAASQPVALSYTYK